MKIKRGYLVAGLLTLLISIITEDLSAQGTTYNNITGYWNETRVWENGFIPPFDNLSGQTTINGTILLDESISNRDGQIIINDTLIIKGDLELRQNSILIVNANAVLIVQGNTYSKNKTNMFIDGTFIVGKDFIGVGSKSTIEFGADSKMFIVGNVSKGSKNNFPLLNCEPTEYPENCYYGDLSKLEQDSIYSTFTSGGYKINHIGNVSFCEGNTLRLYVSPNVVDIQWLKDGIPMIGETNDTLNVFESGQYSAQFIDYLSQSYTTTEINVQVYSLPVVTLGNDLEACYGNTISLDAGNEFNSYLWNTGNTTQVLDISETGSNKYWVNVEDINSCQNISDTITVTIHELPTVTLGEDQEACFGNTISLDADNEFNSYLWNTGDTDQVIDISEAGSDQYWVNVEDTNGCQNSSDTVTITIHELSTISLGEDQEACLGNTISLDAGNDYISYLWNTGDTLQMLEISGVSSNQYWVNIEDINGCQSSSDTITVTIHELPTISLGEDQEACLGNTISLDAGNDYISYLWNTSETEQVIEISEAGSNQYWVNLEDTNGCLNSSDTVTITIHELPTISLGEDQEACLGNTISLDAGNDYISYLWNTGDTLQMLEISGVSNNQYWVTIEDINGCIGISDSVYIHIKPTPTASISGTDTLCNGQTISLTAHGGTVYQWNTGENTSIITASPTENSTYSVIASNEFSCSDTAYFNVVVKEGFELSINGESEVCSGASTILSISEGYDILWSNGETGLSIEVTPTSETEISVTARNSVGCYDTATTTINVVEPDFATITGPMPDESGLQLILMASEGSAYLWSTGETTQTILYDNDNSEDYWVIITNQDGCQDTAIAPRAVCSYDYFSCAENLGDISNWTSDNAAYDNSDAGQDGNNASCLTEQPDKNVWFKFYAQTTINSIAVMTGNQFGTMQGQQLVVTDINGNEIECIEAVANYQGPLVLYTNLQAENTYYIMVDDRSTSGSFSLRINEHLSNDNFADAYLIETPSSWISLPMQFTTLGATRDGEKITCTDERPNNNVWFKFKANTRTISIKVGAGENLGTIADPVITLYDASQEELSCITQTGNNSVKLSNKDLKPNSWYYFAVSNINDLTGSFTLRTNNSINPGNIYYAVKDGDWNSNIWSENPYDTEGSGVIPSLDDIVYIKNHQVDVNTIVYAFSVYILLGNTSALNVSPGAKVELVKRMYLYNE